MKGIKNPKLIWFGEDGLIVHNSETHLIGLRLQNIFEKRYIYEFVIDWQDFYNAIEESKLFLPEIENFKNLHYTKGMIKKMTYPKRIRGGSTTFVKEVKNQLIHLFKINKSKVKNLINLL